MRSDSERCNALLMSLARKKNVYQDMKLGKTMVFYRPDVHNSLERDKLDVGMRAILCLQSCYRRRKAVARVQVLWEARRSLRMTMASGNENQSSNINSIPDLEYWLYYCHQVGLYSYDIVEGQRLLERLQSVKVCLEQLQYLLENGSVTYRHDVTLEFTALQEAIQQAELLDIIHPICSDIRTRRDELKGRATSVLALRDAVAQLNENLLDTCLQSIETMVQEFGEFCELEKRNASILLDRLMLEISTLNEAFSAITNTQGDLDKAIEIEFGDSSRGKGNVSIKDILTDSLSTISNIMFPISDANNYHRPLSTPPSENIFIVIELIVKIRSGWINNDWQLIVDYVIEISKIGKILWPSNCQVTSDAVQNLAHLFHRVVENETKLVAQGIDVHVVLPMLNNGINQGRITLHREDVSYLTVDIAPLFTAIEKVRKIESLGEKARALLLVVEKILSLRTAAADENFEMILALTEPSPVTSCRHMRQQKLLSALQGTFSSRKLHKQSSMGFSVNDLQETENIDIESLNASNSNVKPLSNFPSTDLSLLNDEDRLFEAALLEKTRLLSGPFLASLNSIQEEIEKARINSCDKYAQVLSYISVVNLFYRQL